MYNNTQDDPAYIARAYFGARITDYPSIQSQLDMLWHDVDNGLFGESAKQSEWFSAVKAVKEKHPKPE